MADTITSSQTTGVTLSSSTQNPLTINANVTVASSSNKGVYGESGTVWTVNNAGTVTGGSRGVQLNSGGSVNNTGSIAGLKYSGIFIQYGAGIVTNTGTVTGTTTGITLAAGGTVTNTGAASEIFGASSFGVGVSGAAGTVMNAGSIVGVTAGVHLSVGGAITNTGSITATGKAGVYIGGGAGTITDAGAIAGSTYAVQFAGSFADRLILDPGAVLTGTVVGGTGTNTLELAGMAGQTGTLANFASFTNFDTVAVDSGATWVFASGETFGSGVTVTNNGSIASTVTLGAGAGPLTNSGTIAGGTYGVRLRAGGTVVNSGTASLISSTGLTAIYVQGIGSISNSGIISGNLDGVELSAGGTVTNIGPGSQIKADTGIFITGGAGMVSNAGTISGADIGVLLEAKSRVVNTGSIGSSGDGIFFSDAAGTILNGGTISGGSYAIQFRGSYADRVILVQGAVLNGKVQGGSGTNTLELASSVPTGTLANFAAFTNFGTIAVDAGTRWVFSQANTIGSGVTITDSGTLINAGSIGSTVTVVAGAGPLTNSGTIAGDTCGVTLSAGGTVVNSGTASLIASTGGGIYVTGSVGQIFNDGAITGYDDGVDLSAGGSVTNTDAGSQITAGIDGVFIKGNSGTVLNAGIISGNEDGVVLEAGGRVSNTGQIASNDYGINIFGAAGTVTDAGTITGGRDAIYFGASFADRVILDPGAVLSGKVHGGSGTNTLELAGSSGQTGTLSNFGSFTNFGAVAVDTGANWVFSQGNTIGTGVTITDAGALINAGRVGSTVTVVAGAGPLTNAGTIAGANVGVLETGGGTIVDSGAISGATYAIQFLGSSADRLILDPGAALTGTVAGSGTAGATNTLELAATAGQTGTVANVFTNFGTVVVDNGATWTFAAGNAIGTGVTITDAGALTNADSVGSTVTVTSRAGPLTNSGSITGGQYGVYLTAGGSVSNVGTASAIAATGTTGVNYGVKAKGAGTITNAGTMKGYTGVYLGDGSVTNSGTASVIIGTGDGGDGLFGGAASTVTNAGTIQGNVGVFLNNGGTVTNSGTASQIIGTSATNGYADGIAIEHATGVVSNAGTISGSGYGVLLAYGGGSSSVINTGTITAKNRAGIFFYFTGGTVTNAGAISGSTYAIRFSGTYDDRVILDPGAVLSGTVAGGSGTNTLELAASSAGTVTNFSSQFSNFGTIAEDAGASWTLAGSGETIAAGIGLGAGAQLAINESGTVALNGVLSGAGTLIQAGSGLTRLAASDSFSGGAFIQAGTLDIAAGATPGSGAITFAGTGGGTLEIDGPSFANTISGFVQGDVINLSALAYDKTGTATLLAGNVLDVHEDNQDYLLNLDPNQNYAGDMFVLSDPTGTDITVQPVCFAQGTRIRVAHGAEVGHTTIDIPVEDLVVGDRVVTASGAARPIRWLGRRGVDCSAHPRPHEANPIRIAAHALAPNHPARDLFVSPGHAICVDIVGAVLIPAFALVNGATIQQVEVEDITYWHVELDSHDVILAENLACESYLDMGNRAFFADNSLVALDASPDAAVPTHADFCRPFHMAGPLVEVVRGQVSARAREMGWRLEAQGLDDLHLLVDGVRVAPQVRGFVARFALPAAARDVWLVSPTSIPAVVVDSPDLRALGACLTGLAVDDGFGACQTIALDDPRLCVGFHALEGDATASWRWTAGRARLPASLWADIESEHGGEDQVFLRVKLAGPMLPHWVAPAAARDDLPITLAG